jgi:hypothetical protein
MIKSLIVAVALLLQCGPAVKPLELESPVRTTLFGDITKPKRLTTLRETSDMLGTECAKSIWTQMLFKDYDVLLFEWSGSGQDELIIHDIEDGVCIFEYKRGRTRDLRRHTKAFSIPVKMDWEILE